MKLVDFKKDFKSFFDIQLQFNSAKVYTDRLNFLMSVNESNFLKKKTMKRKKNHTTYTNMCF